MHIVFYRRKAIKLDGSPVEDGGGKTSAKNFEARIVINKKRVGARQSWDRTMAKISDYKSLTVINAKITARDRKVRKIFVNYRVNIEDLITRTVYGNDISRSIMTVGF